MSLQPCRVAIEGVDPVQGGQALPEQPALALLFPSDQCDFLSLRLLLQIDVVEVRLVVQII
ncbi:hypothetical protein ACLJYM_25860 [Rhizobium giardinii]|uniref:hypothetical protein n=1 Tax=Rhizobium giardinii TaxID=56731 RepID=UPI0013AFD16C